MARKKALLDADGMLSGNSWTNNSPEEDRSFRSLLEEQHEGCIYCEYEGALRYTRKGYKCPKCKEIIIPLE